jgi:hypothetical protein
MSETTQESTLHAFDRIGEAKREYPDLIPWLLASRTPSIRYLTLRRLLNRPEADAEVRVTRREMTASGPIPAILAGQTERGNWAGERSYYTPKYVSTHWSMTLLTELAADRQDERLRRGAGFMLAATEDELRAGGHGMSCFWGNLLRYTLHAGLGDDPRAAGVVAWLVRDGIEAGWRCQINNELSCAWGATRALWGLAGLPAENRSPEVAAAIESGLAFLLASHHLVEADYPTPGRVHSLWSRLNFPLFYQADILFVLRVAAELGALDRPGAQPALAWLTGRRSANGRWRGANPFRSRTWPGLADPEETDRWVSLHAAIILAGPKSQ